MIARDFATPDEADRFDVLNLRMKEDATEKRRLLLRWHQRMTRHKQRGTKIERENLGKNHA